MNTGMICAWAALCARLASRKVWLQRWRGVCGAPVFGCEKGAGEQMAATPHVHAVPYVPAGEQHLVFANIDSKEMKWPGAAQRPSLYRLGCLRSYGLLFSWPRCCMRFDEAYPLSPSPTKA